MSEKICFEELENLTELEFDKMEDDTSLDPNLLHCCNFQEAIKLGSFEKNCWDQWCLVNRKSHPIGFCPYCGHQV